MTKNEIENFVERKITEAQLEISEKRLTFALKLGAGFVCSGFWNCCTIIDNNIFGNTCV